jgi:hypothetical protein
MVLVNLANLAGFGQIGHQLAIQISTKSRSRTHLDMPMLVVWYIDWSYTLLPSYCYAWFFM